MKNFLTILFLFCAVSAFGQRKPEPVFNSGIFAIDTVKYDKNFKFNDGIYLERDGINTTSEWVSEEVQDSYLLDYHTGKSFLYDFKNLEDFLEKRDFELYSEFKNLTEREKRKSMDSFVFKYNQKHPLYIPVYEKV